jgi:hypothetical protein
MRQAVFFTAYSLVGLAPENGEISWRVPWKTRWDVSAATPVLIPPDKIFISAGDKSAVIHLKAQRDSVVAEEVTKSRWSVSTCKGLKTALYNASPQHPRGQSADQNRRPAPQSSAQREDLPPAASATEDVYLPGPSGVQD